MDVFERESCYSFFADFCSFMPKYTRYFQITKVSRQSALKYIGLGSCTVHDVYHSCILCCCVYFFIFFICVSLYTATRDGQSLLCSTWTVHVGNCIAVLITGGFRGPRGPWPPKMPKVANSKCIFHSVPHSFRLLLIRNVLKQ